MDLGAGLLCVCVFPLWCVVVGRRVKNMIFLSAMYGVADPKMAEISTSLQPHQV